MNPSNDHLYDDFNDFYGEIPDAESLEQWEDESMDGDHESGLASAGFGTDEDYGYYGESEDW